MVPLYQPEYGVSPFASTGLVQIQGNGSKQQKPAILVYYDGVNADVPTLVCPGHLKLLPAFGDATGNPVEIPYFDIRKIVTVTGSSTVTRKKIRVTCNLENCADNSTFGVKIERIADVRFPNPKEQWYFDFEAGLDEDCTTDCSDRPQILVDKINNNPLSIVVASLDTTTTPGTTYLVLEDKTDNADFRAHFEGFTNYTVVTNYSAPSYTVGQIREIYPSFASSLAANTALTATEIVFEKRVVKDGFAGTSSFASHNETFEIQRYLAVVLTNATTNSAAAKTELDAITNGTKTTSLYLDKNC